MKMLLKNVLIILVFLLSTCSDENPTITETGNGKVIIESNVERGEIFLEGKFTGLFTPDTLELLAVTHLVKVRKKGYFSEERKLSFKKNEIRIEHFELSKNNLIKNVLIENFMFVDCDSCKESFTLFKNLKQNYGDQLQIINYPAFLENPNEKIYTDVKLEVDNRLQFYNILDYEQPYLDGIYIVNIEDDIKNNLLLKPKLTITISDTIAQGGILILSLFIDVFDLDEIVFNNLVLISAIVENDVNFPDMDSERKVNSLLRSMFSIPKGISLNGIIKTGRARFALSEILLPSWNIEKLSIISFIQNYNTKEVVQTGFKKLLF